MDHWLGVMPKKELRKKKKKKNAEKKIGKDKWTCPSDDHSGGK